MRALILIFFAVAVVPTEAVRGQSERFDPFALPKPGLITCRAGSPRPQDSAAFAQAFTDESDAFDSRETQVLFDSSGAARLLNLFASKQVGDSSYGEAFTIRFSQGFSGLHVRAIAQLPPGTKPADPMPVPLSIKRENVVLTLDEVRQASALAAWIWTHRCQSSFPIEM